MTLPDRADITTYGGSKVNFGPVEDETTDRDATQANFAYADVAMMTRTASRCWADFTTSATTPTLNLHWAMWGSSLSVAPAVARTGTGVFTLTWPTTVTDIIETIALGQATHTVNLLSCSISLIAGPSGAPILFSAQVTSANVVTVKTFSIAGAAADEAGAILHVEGK